MNKNLKILGLGAVAVIILALAWKILVPLFFGPPPGGSADYLLSSEEKTQIRAASQKIPGNELDAKAKERLTIFLQSFSALFNSYGYQDYNNIQALADYQTPAMQKKTVERLATLARETKPGFSVSTEPDISTLAFAPTGNNIFSTTLKAAVEEFDNNQSVKKYQAEYVIKVELSPEKKFLVDDVMLFPVK